MSTSFYSLTVGQVEKTTPDCVLVTLEVPADLQEVFSYKHGQYLTFEVDLNGEPVRRSYSICSSPLDGEWRVGIKKVEGGKFSTYANEVLQAGDVLRVMPPDGRFFVDVDTERKKNYVAFAAGSGITPVFSVIKTHLQAEPNSTFTLFYVNQRVGSIILKEELEALKNIYMDRFEMFHFLTRERRNVELFNGRLSEEKLEVIFKTICNAEEVDDFFCCGPEDMIIMVRDFLVNQEVDKKKIHFELFHAEGAHRPQKEALRKAFQGKSCQVTILEGGKTFSFDAEQGHESILDSALQNAADLPFACKGGVCCTCRAKLVEGEVDMQVNYALEEDEVKAGFILTCQSIPISEKVTVNYDV